MVWGLPEGVGSAGWRGENGKSLDNGNSIMNTFFFNKRTKPAQRQTMTKNERQTDRHTS